MQYGPWLTCTSPSATVQSWLFYPLYVTVRHTVRGSYRPYVTVRHTVRGSLAVHLLYDVVCLYLTCWSGTVMDVPASYWQKASLLTL